VKRRLAAYRLTPAGSGLLFVLGAALIVLLIGPHHDEGPAFIIIAIVLFMLVLGAAPPGRWPSFDQSLSERRARFHPRSREADAQPESEAENEDWQREREIYLERERRPDG
jgi:hypothetical protein